MTKPACSLAAVLTAMSVAVILAGCAGPGESASRGPSITGFVSYKENVALPPNAVLEVQLQDVTRRDEVGTILSTVTITPVGRLPVFFRIRYEPRQVDAERRYALLAKISIGGKIRYLNTNGALVLTGGNPTHRDLVLERAREP